MNTEQHQWMSILACALLLAGIIGVFIIGMSSPVNAQVSPAPPKPLADKCPDIKVSDIAGSGSGTTPADAKEAAKTSANTNCDTVASGKVCKPTDKCINTGTNPGNPVPSTPTKGPDGNYYAVAITNCTAICDPVD